MSKKTIVPAVMPVLPPPAEPKKGCGCNGGGGAAYDAPEPYEHNGKMYLWKAYVVNDRNNGNVILPAHQIFELAAGKVLCDECFNNYPILAPYLTAERTDNGMAKAIVDWLFDIQSPLLSEIPTEE